MSAGELLFFTGGITSYVYVYLDSKKLRESTEEPAN